MSIAERVLGPRVPPELLAENRARYRLPVLCFGLAAVILVLSMFFPYWHLDLKAPQFPQGLQIHAFVNRLEGDVNEVQELNHYVGMPSFDSGAVFERSVAVAAILVFAGLILAGFYIHNRWVLPFVLPALLFPFIFIGDLQFWLWRYGHELDPRAPLTDAVGEFTPPIFGKAKIAQFDTNALPDIGLWLALAASALVTVGLWLHRRAYKPLVEAVEADEGGERTSDSGAGTPEPSGDHGAVAAGATAGPDGP